MNHTSIFPGDGGSFSRDESNRDKHEINLGRDYPEAERFWTTDEHWPAASLHELSDTQKIDRILALAVPSSLEFRKVQAGPPKSHQSKSHPAPDTPPSHRSWHSMEEDPEAVEVDEALDGSRRVEHHEPGQRDQLPQAQEIDVSSKRRAPPLLLSPRDTGQLKILRITGQREGENFAKASADFMSWKRLLKEVSNSGSKSPSSVELRMHYGVLALDSADSMANFLDYSSPGHKQKVRNRILLYTTLRHAPEKGAMVLKALMSVSRLPFYMIEDSLGFLAFHLRQMEPAMKQDCAQMLADLVVQTAQIGDKGHIRLTQNTIYSILIALPPAQLEGWFQQLMEHEIPLHKYTLLQFASRFAKMSATKELSLDIWRDVCETGSLDINTPVGASLCTSLLTFKDDDLHGLDENLATPAELFQSLLDMGLIPNVITYTTIIRSLCAKKDLQTAMEVFEVMKQHGVQPDNFTHSVMMHGFKSCGDFRTMLHFASNARATGVQDSVVWNDVIHATFLACLKEPRVPGGVRRARCVVWGPMNAIFARFFNPEPLRTLITSQFTDVRSFMEKQGHIPDRMRGAFHEIQQLQPQELIQPTSSTMSLMVLGFVRHLPRPNDVVFFYDHFKKLLREGNPVARSIVQEQGSIVHDIVLRSLLKWKGTLRIMLSIIRDMMTDIQSAAAVTHPLSLQTYEPQIIDPEPIQATDLQGPAVDYDTSRPGGNSAIAADNAEEAEWEAANREKSTIATALSDARSQHGEVGPPIRHPRPSIHTWSILLKAFMSNRLPQEAENILKLMRIHGVKPTIVTWNTLAAGYAKLGDTKQAVEAMRRLEAAGFASDDWTMRAFSYIRDKTRAISLMEQKVEENKLTKAADEELGQQQEEDKFDELIGHESEVEEDGLSLYYQEAMGIAPEDSQWLPPERMTSTRKEKQPEAQDSGMASGEPQPLQTPRHEVTNKPAANRPAATKRDLGAWDNFLWDHAGESGPEEQGKRDQSAA